MTEPNKLTEDEVKSLLVCPECGGQAYSHTDLARQSGAGTCRLNVMESRVAAVEVIVEARVTEALDAVEADLKSKAWTPQWGRDDWMHWLRSRRGAAEPEVRAGFEGVGGHAPGCDGWRPPTALGFGRTSPARCIPGCPMARERTP